MIMTKNKLKKVFYFIFKFIYLINIFFVDLGLVNFKINIVIYNFILFRRKILIFFFFWYKQNFFDISNYKKNFFIN
jgi:hypothetical protein